MPPTKRKQAESDSEEEKSTMYSKMTLVQLRAELRKRGLETKGKKDELIAMLEDDDQGGASSETEKAEKKPAAKRGRKKKEESEDEAEEEKEEEPKPAPKSKRLQEKTEAKAVKEESTGNWIEIDGRELLVLTSSSLKASNRVACFDMDDTLICTKSGKVHATHRGDWKWLYPEVPGKLKKIHEEGIKLVIFTNQGGINGKNGWDNTKERDIKGKIEDIIAELGVPIQAFIATSDTKYRKPNTAMWDTMAEKYNDGVALDLSKCIYVGDAAGRDVGWKSGKKKDFACTDRKFAYNCGIQFHTPEEYFLGEVASKFDWRGFNPVDYKHDGSEITEGGVAKLTSDKQEMIVFVGFPASGKSTLAKTYLVPKGYVHVNRDTLKTPAKCLAAARAAIEEGKSVVIDNTCPKAADRADYINIAKAAGVPVRCFRFDIDLEFATHMNYFRERTGGVDHVPKIAYAVFNKNFSEPEKSEGFTEVRKVRFVPNFANDNIKKEFMKFAHDT